MHKRFDRVAAGLLGYGAWASAASPSLIVSFVRPENYTDAGYSRSFASEKDRAEVQRDIEEHLQRLAERRLAAGDVLKVEVLDIDLAGRFEPFRFRAGSDVRIVSDITWPRMKLRYTLTRGGQTIADAEEQLVDMNYLVSTNRYSSSDRLRYEKAMLDDWFEKRVVKR